MVKLKGAESWDLWHEQSVFEFKSLNAIEYIIPDGFAVEPEPEKPLSYFAVKRMYQADLDALDAVRANALAQQAAQQAEAAQQAQTAAQATDAASTQSSTLTPEQQSNQGTQGGEFANGQGGAGTQSGIQGGTPTTSQDTLMDIVTPEVPSEEAREKKRNVLIKEWTIESAEYDKFIKAKKDVLTYFKKTIDPSMYSTINKVNTMHEMYNIIRNTYQPSDTVF